MAKIKQAEIIGEVKKVLLKVKKAGSTRRLLTSYQILERLPAETRERVIKDHGKAGKKKKGTSHYSAAIFVGNAARTICEERTWLELDGLKIAHKGKVITGGSPICALYRLREP